MRQFGR